MRRFLLPTEPKEDAQTTLEQTRGRGVQDTRPLPEILKQNGAGLKLLTWTHGWQKFTDLSAWGGTPPHYGVNMNFGYLWSVLQVLEYMVNVEVRELVIVI